MINITMMLREGRKTQVIYHNYNIKIRDTL